MPNEGYRKRLEQWEAQQREIARQKESDSGYESGAMKVRVPLGCILLGGVLLLSAIYGLVASAAWWKRLLF
jgi:hypothetical protein